MKKLLGITAFLFLITMQSSNSSPHFVSMDEVEELSGKIDREIESENSKACGKKQNQNMQYICCVGEEGKTMARYKFLLNSLTNAKKYCGKNAINGCVKQFLKQKYDINYRCELKYE